MIRFSIVDRQIVRMYLREGKTQAQIAKEIKVSRAKVSEVIKNIKQTR